MAEYTSRLNLYKPNRADTIPVDTSLSENFEKIDNAVEQAYQDFQKRETAETVTVGTQGDFNSLNQALEFITRKNSVYNSQGLRVEVQLLSGFVLDEQVIVDGQDLGWIVITSVDPVVMIDGAGITEVVIESRRPAFLGINNATLPVIGVQFDYGTGPKGDGITVAFGSKVLLLAGSGVDNAIRGLGAYYGSQAVCYMQGLTEGGAGTGAGAQRGVSFKNCTNRAFMATYSSHINCARSILTNCSGDYAVYCIWNSSADIYQSDMSGATNTAVSSRDGSKVNARETNVSGSNRGYHALHGATINARYYANQWSGDGAKNCSDYAVLASYNSFIEAPSLPTDGSRMGAHASDGSIIDFTGGSALNCTSEAVFAVRASLIEASNVDASGSKNGFLAHAGSTVNAGASKANNCQNGFWSKDSSKINARDSFANNCSINGYLAEFDSGINADFAEAKNSAGNGFLAQETSNIQARSADATGAGAYGFWANRASMMNARNALANNCNTGIMAGEGSVVNAVEANASGSTAFQIRVFRGGTISANNAVGTLSQTALTPTANGVIYQ